MITYTFEELVAHKAAGVPEAALDALKTSADEILTKPTYKVTDIEIPRPSGDLHDYVSIGPYWWPNPDTPDGLPWVNRDGQYNPVATSAPRAVDMYTRVHRLALAEFYFGGGKYAEYAVKQIRDWFINPETRMNPHATFAQGIPGVCEGRSTGLIDFASPFNLFNAIGIFENLGLIDAETVAEVKSWFVEFADWILTHEYGIGAGNSGNNHGSWHDANLIATAIFTDRDALIRKICNTAYRMRIVKNINEKGEQPAELRRTQSLGYSFFNLRAMLLIASVAERYGYKEYFGKDSLRGECILASAVNFLYDYVKNPEAYPYENIHGVKGYAGIKMVLLVLAKRFPDADFAERAAEFDAGDADLQLEPVF